MKSTERKPKGLVVSDDLARAARRQGVRLQVGETLRVEVVAKEAARRRHVNIFEAQRRVNRQARAVERRIAGALRLTLSRKRLKVADPAPAPEVLPPQEDVTSPQEGSWPPEPWPPPWAGAIRTGETDLGTRAREILRDEQRRG